MANSCDISNKYSKDTDFIKIKIAIKRAKTDMELRAKLESMYGEDSSLVDTILDAIQNNEFGPNWDIDTPVSNVSPEETPVNINGAQKEEAPETNPLEEFYYNRERGYIEIHEAEQKFIDEVLARVLYDKKTRIYQNPSTENVNTALYEYKLSLLKNLWQATGINHESEITSDESFNKVINKTILEFGNIASTQDSVYYNDYIILKKFNDLLTKFLPFIKLDSAYANVSEHGRTMYIWDPSGKYRSNWTDSEEMDINKVTSPVVKILLSYIPRVNKDNINMINTIGMKTYNTVMSTILVWMHQNKGNYNDVKKVNDDIRKNGLSADYAEMLDVYLRHNPGLNEGVVDVIRGIRKHILNPNTSMMPLALKQALINQFCITAKFSYFSYRVVNGKLQGQYLEDGFVNTQHNQLMRSITSRVRILQEEPRLFKNLLDSVGVDVIKPTGSDSITILLKKEFFGEDVRITVSKSNTTGTDAGRITIEDDLNGRVLNDRAVINLIERVLQKNIPSNYKSIIESMSSENVIEASLFSIFENPIAILLAAVKEGNDHYIFEYNKNTSELRSYMYRSKCIDAARFIGIAKGVDELSVLKNGDGNNLPIFQLAPAMFDMFDMIDYYADAGNDIFLATQRIITDKFSQTISRSTIDNVLQLNPYIVHPQLLKRIVARSDIKINNRVKSSDKLSVAEVTNAAIFTDFYANLIYNPTASENDRKTNRELEGCILLQPITFSDKKTHFLLAVNLLAADAIRYVDSYGNNTSKSALEVFRELTDTSLDQTLRFKYVTELKNQFKNYIADKTKREVFNQFARFYAVFKKPNYSKYHIGDWNSENIKFNFETFDAWEAFKDINGILNEISKEKNPLETIRAAFNGIAALNEDFDFRVVGNKLQSNETVFFNIQTSIVDGGNFDKFVTRNIKNFATNLGEYNIVADLVKNPELADYFNKMSDEAKSKWLDPISNIMKSFIIKENGIERSFTQPEIEDGALYADNIEIELNPIIEAYFYAHNLYAVPANDLNFGEQANYTPKTTFDLDFDTIDPFDQRIEEMMASSLSMEFKRTTFAGAVKRRFATGLTFGLPDMLHFSGIDTSIRYISTIRGETHKAKTQDGNGWVDPLGARMIQGSLVDSPVGDVRKSIFGWTDPRTGCQIHFKWAEDTITTSLRQRDDDDGLLETMLRKGRSKYNIYEKFKKVTNVSKYYSPESKEKYRLEGKVITHTDYIYRYDIDNGGYWRLDSIDSNNGNLITNWTKVDDFYKPTGITDSKSTPIKNLYDLDLAFGGAWVYDLIDGNMVPSEAVNDIMYYMICEYDMKNDLDVFFVGGEACKSGKFNFNSYDKLKIDDKRGLFSYYMRTEKGGILQNSDHELDYSSVTEMTQMITLLSQGGRNVELVNQMYEDIGRVANEALQSIITNIDNEKEIYRILGKALMDTFNSGNRQELGLAQAFIRSAQQSLEKNGTLDNIILPYSAETIKGSFIAAVTSLINKKGIRRKYAGFGGVEVGAEDVVVHWDVDGRHLTYREVRDHYRKTLKDNNITWKQLKTLPEINGKLNPSMKPVKQSEVHFGDTVYLRRHDPVGVTTRTEVIRIDTQPQYDKVAVLLDPNEWDIFVWQAKSKQLEQSDIRINTNTTSFSEYSLDSVRASFYLDELMNYKKKREGWNDEFVERKKNVIRAAISDSDMSVIAGWNVELLWDSNLFDHLIPQLKKLLNRKTSIYMNKLSAIVRSGKIGTLPTQMVEVQDKPVRDFMAKDLLTGELKHVVLPLGDSTISPKIEKRIAQIAMGRKNFEKFLLKKGDRLDEIKTRGESFFYDRLREKATSFNSIRRQIKGTLQYDGMLQLSNGETMLVCVGNPKSGKLYSGQDFVASSDAISYKGKVIVDNKLLKGVGKVTEILTRSLQNPETGQIVPVLIVKDFETFNRISKSTAVTQYKYNYTRNNWRTILEFDKRKGVDVDVTDPETNVSSHIRISGDTHSVIPNEDSETISNIVRLLNRQEQKFNRDRLWNKARVLYRNFLAQLNYLQTRIPSQAMQSTMALEVVDIIDIDTNYLWVPLMTHLFQGSDLDIDKGYCMGYDIDDDGNIFAESDLIFNPDYSVDDIIMLPTPNNSYISFLKPGESSDNIISKNTIFKLMKDGEGNGWKVIDYIKELNKLTIPEKDIKIEDLGLMEGVYNGIPVFLNFDPNVDLWNPAEQYVFLPQTIEFLNRAIQEVNVHNSSAYDERRSAGALRNKVFVAARQIISDPSSQMDHMMPVNLEEAKAAAANSTLGKKEKRISIYTPTTVFEMQQQNMTGKTVIPLSATGIKSFFIISTGYNTKAKQIEKLLEKIDQVDLNQIGTEIAELLNELTFDSIFNPNGNGTILRTFANINFDGILEKAEKFKIGGKNLLNEIVLTKQIFPTRANEQNWNNYFEGGRFRLYDLIVDLNDTANGNKWVAKTRINPVTQEEEIDWEYFVVNAADSLGVLLNAAADNAKELVLEKLNANDKFADFYVVLLMLGYKFDDIAKEMTGRTFRIVTRYAGDNIFDPSTHSFSTRNAIDFVLDVDDLPCIDKGMLSAYISNGVDENGKYNGAIQLFKGFGLYLLDHDFALDNKMSFLGYLKTQLDFSKLSNISSASSVADQFRSAFTKSNSEWNKSFYKNIMSLLKDDSLKTVDGISVSKVLTNLLLQHLKEAIELLSSDASSNTQLAYRPETPEQDAYSEPDVTDLLDLEDIPIDFNSVSGASKFDRAFTLNDLKQLYRYLQLYLIPKNDAWQTLTPEERTKGTKVLMEIKTNILHALDEIKMVGAYGSINQGLKVGDFQEYAFVERIQNFVNTAYLNRTRASDLEATDPEGKPFNNFEPFDLLRFLDDNDKKYHERQIAQYNRVKAVVNILQAIDGIASFKVMFKYTRLNRDLISHAAAVKFERIFAKEALLQDKDRFGINLGLKNRFNQQEFDILRRYTRDVIILNFFMRYGKSMVLSMPQGTKYYAQNSVDGTISSDNKVIGNNGKTIFLNNVVDLANFKRLMDRYIIPKLIEDDRFKSNMFIRALTQDDDSRDEFTGKSLTGYRLDIPLINLENERDIDNYSKALYGFNQLMFTPVPEEYKLAPDGNGISQWTIGNLFFIYNLMCYKDRIGGNSMTRLMEDVISSSNKGTLPYLYYKYLNNIDRDLEDIYDENGNIDPNKFLYDIRDLLYRLAPVKTAYKFGVKANFTGRYISKVNVKGESIDTIQDQHILSDFVFGMPFITRITDLSIFKPAKDIEGFNKEYSYSFNSSDVFDEMVEALFDTYGRDIPVAVLTNEEIPEWFPSYTKEQIERLQNSRGFIIDGCIYLNKSKYKESIDTPVHEIMHFIAAGMKYNQNPSIRSAYYKLLDNVISRVQNPKTEDERRLFNDLSKKYENRTASDKAEEFLVTLLAREFQTRFSDVWGESRVMSKQLLQATVRSVLSEVFKDERIKSWDQEGIDFADISLESMTTLFMRQILTMDPKLHSGNIAVNQELAELKNFLEENGYINLEDCL